MAGTDLSAAQLLAALQYDRETGVLRWLTRPSNSVQVGDVAGTPYMGGYLALKMGKRRYLAHRVAWLLAHGCWPAGVIDHIDGDKTNNALSNLRDVGSAVNAQNRRSAHKGNLSGYLGVSWRKDRCKWEASIKVDGKSQHIGFFKDAEAAHTAYLERKRRIHPGCTI